MSGQKKARTASVKRALATAQNYKDVFNNDVGKRVLWDLMKESGFNKVNFHGDATNLVYLEGARSIVLYIMRRLNVSIADLEKRIEQGEKEDQNIFGGG